jgi:uncharacterized protein (DUF433 family)
MAINDWQKVKTDRKMVLGRYIVADPEICHGKLTFRGTRVFVADILEQVAEGMSFQSIEESWRGVDDEAIKEAVRLAREALLKYWPEMEIKDAQPHDRSRRKHRHEGTSKAG